MNRLFIKIAFGFVMAAVMAVVPVSAQEMSKLDRKVSVSVENMAFGTGTACSQPLSFPYKTDRRCYFGRGSG